ncbi:hypothetical protein IFO70_06650 [Phormidium tenue FACHB-886]|nr:hypothetical protein [Phormidium tenue FACHB-886]
MTESWLRIVKSAYRREQLSSFVLLVGLVDALIGGISNHGLLLGLGLATVGVAIVLRWTALQRQTLQLNPKPVRVLPERSTRPLPPLDLSQRGKL